MPGFYPVEEYDLAGFCVGLADYDKIVDSKNVKPGDALVGVKSSGVHSNGFSLVRKVFDVSEKTLARHYDELGKTLGEALLTPTKIYVKALRALMAKVPVHGISHITGGGYYENIPRMLPDGLQAVIDLRGREETLTDFSIFMRRSTLLKIALFLYAAFYLLTACFPLLLCTNRSPYCGEFFRGNLLTQAGCWVL